MEDSDLESFFNLQDDSDVNWFEFLEEECECSDLARFLELSADLELSGVPRADPGLTGNLGGNGGGCSRKVEAVIFMNVLLTPSILDGSHCLTL